MKIKVLKHIKLSKTINYGNLGNKDPILLTPSEDILEISDKWRNKLTDYYEYVEIIEDEVEDTETTDEAEDTETTDEAEDK